MTTQAMTKSADLKRTFSESVERDRRAFEMMAADRTLSFFDAMKRILHEEQVRQA